MEFSRVKKSGGTTDMHPTLAALLIVLKTGGDLGEINRVHPQIRRFRFFNSNAQFPEDISNFLPEADRWWEDLGESWFLPCECSLHFFLKANESRERMARQGAPPAPPVTSASRIDFPPHSSSSAHRPAPPAPPPLRAPSLPRAPSLARSLPVPPSSTPLPEPPLPPRRSAGVVCLPSLNLLKKRLAAGRLGNNGDDGDSDGGEGDDDDDDYNNKNSDDDDDDDDNGEEKDELVGESDSMALDEFSPPRVSHLAFPFFSF